MPPAVVNLTRQLLELGPDPDADRSAELSAFELEVLGHLMPGAWGRAIADLRQLDRADELVGQLVRQAWERIPEPYGPKLPRRRRLER